MLIGSFNPLVKFCENNNFSGTGRKLNKNSTIEILFSIRGTCILIQRFAVSDFSNVGPVVRIGFEGFHRNTRLLDGGKLQPGMFCMTQARS